MQHATSDAVFEDGDVEVNRQSDLPAAKLEIGQQLSVVNRQQGFYGLYFHYDEDETSFENLTRGEFSISGLRNRDLRRVMPEKTCSQISRTLRRLRLHGLLKRAGSTYKYYLTKLGRLVLLAGLKLKELFIIPQLVPAQTRSQSAHLGSAVAAEA